MFSLRLFGSLLLALLGSCGGGGSGSVSEPTAPETCEAQAQKSWLRDYMQQSYLWADAAPNPAPQTTQSLAGYFSALLFTGDAKTPADRWSYITNSAAYEQFFEDGITLGYGLAVNGLEGQLPLKIRYVEPGSPAALAGLVRGDEIVTINGRTAAQVFDSGDFSALNPAQVGDTLTLQVVSLQGSRAVTLAGATYALTPVPVIRVLDLPDGKRVAYLVLKDFVFQARSPLVSAFAEFRAAGATELVLDLRYNGGGLISVAEALASLVAGQAHSGQLFTALVFNPRFSRENQKYLLDAQAPGFTRVVVLNGRRTCSASELLVNGLTPYLPVVTLGETTCGKPVGFTPAEHCSSSVNAVNFEAVNALGQGRYYDGLAPVCAVAEDFSGVLGDPAEKLLAAASTYLTSGKCPGIDVALGRQGRSLSLKTPNRGPIFEPERFPGMRSD